MLFKNDLEKVTGLDQEIYFEKEYSVDISMVLDLQINPRNLNKQYAEEMPLETPPVILGVITDEPEYENEKGETINIKDKFILIDGNHRFYSKKHILEEMFINAIIKKYPTMDDAKLDAYKFNTSHGKPLTDREIFRGVMEASNILKKRTGDVNFSEIARMLGITQRQVRMYNYWSVVQKVLGEEIQKSKADLVVSILKTDEVNKKLTPESVANLRKFWQLNGHLKYSELVKAKQHYNNTGEIVSFEHANVDKMLSLDSFDVLGPVKTNVTDAPNVEVNAKPKTVESSAIVGDETGFVTKTEENTIEKFNTEMKNNFKKRQMSIETLTLNLLKGIQETLIDNATSFSKIIKEEIDNNPESKENLRKKGNELKGVLANIKSKIDEIEASLGLED